MALALGPALAEAAFTLHTEVDARKIGVEDQLQLTITLEGGDAPDEIPLPPLANLEVAAGPFQSSQMSIVNGRMSQSRSLTYVLRPKGVGKAEVGALTAGGQTAPAIPIDVVAGSVGQRPSARQDPLRMDPFRDPFEGMLGRRSGRPALPKLLVTATPSRSRGASGRSSVRRAGRASPRTGRETDLSGTDPDVEPGGGRWCRAPPRSGWPGLSARRPSELRPRPFPPPSAAARR